MHSRPQLTLSPLTPPHNVHAVCVRPRLQQLLHDAFMPLDARMMERCEVGLHRSTQSGVVSVEVVGWVRQCPQRHCRLK